jgi:hypothetical protein
MKTEPPKHYKIVAEGLEFPAGRDIKINMMPFIQGQRDSIPIEYRHYFWPIIQHCKAGQAGEIGYLSIHESWVEPGQAQRRPGIHTEGYATPGKVRGGWGGGGWGGGTTPPDINDLGAKGGLFMVSNMADTCQVWDTRIDGYTRPGGDCEYLRAAFGPGRMLQPGELCWLTDRTPHESAPANFPAYRQWCRVVTKAVSVWFADHSTPNPLGVKPQAKIVHGNKFASL